MILTDEQIQQALLNTGIDQETVDGFVEYPHSTSIVMNGVELHTFVEIIEKMIVPEGYVVVPVEPIKPSTTLQRFWNNAMEGYKYVLAAHKKGE